MKTIGLIGGMSWVSTAIYYRLINEAVNERLGGYHSAQIALWSVDFAEIERMQVAGDWGGAGERLADAARRLERAGADVILITANTMHKVADAVGAAVRIPFIHIADATASEIKRKSCRRPLLLATAYTMEQEFYVGRLRQRHDIDVRVPNARDRAVVHRVIFEELVHDDVRPKSRAAFMDIVTRELQAGADGVIFGCTEICLLLSQDDFDVPCFDTTAIHAQAAVDFSLAS
ncbi:MAG: amino acid racemase [Alphaproteobacteria bacterium]|nr:amino acid racemase [Alphaproteobacteria bacterium]